MAAGWKRFDMQGVVKASDSEQPKRIFVIRRPNGKLNIGTIESINPDGVTLSNGSWTYTIPYATTGHATLFTAFDPPVVEVNIADQKLV